LRSGTDDARACASVTDEADIEHHSQNNKNADYWLARGHRFDHLRREHEFRRQRQSRRVGSDRSN
jgi:hypothetical protein